MAKARFIKEIRNTNPLDRHAWEHTDLLYEYRGYEYIVTRHNNGYSADSLREQHAEEQRKIDERIARTNEVPAVQKYEGSAQEGFDMFFEWCNQ